MNINPEVQDALRTTLTALEALVTGSPRPGKGLGTKGRENGVQRPIRDVPLFTPTGEDVKTLDVAAAMMGVDRLTASFYVLEADHAHPQLVQEAKMHAAPKSDQDGISLMLIPSKRHARWIASSNLTALGDDDASFLHVTLGYFGEVGKTKITHEHLMSLGQYVADTFAPFKANMAGVTRFRGKDEDPLVLNVDSPDLEDMRAFLLDKARSLLERSHGYTPHMTVGYLNHDEPIPYDRWPENSREDNGVLFDRLVIAYGEDYTIVPLTGKRGGSDKLNEETKDVFGGLTGGGLSPYKIRPGIRPRRERIRKIIERAGAIEERRRRKKKKKRSK